VQNELKLWIYLQVEKLMYMERRKKTRELKNVIRSSVNSSPATHNLPGHVITTRFQHLLWPQLGCLILGTYLIIGSFTLLVHVCSSGCCYTSLEDRL